MTELIPLKCPSCGADIKVREGASLAVCGYCGGQHIVAPASQQRIGKAEPYTAGAQTTSEKVEPIRPRVRPESSLQVASDSQRLRISRRWYNPSYIFMAVFTLFWDGFLVVWYGIAAAGGAPLMMLVFPLLHVAVGLFLTYSVVCGFANRTIVELTREHLEVWHEPLPWPGEKTLPSVEIRQLYVKEQVKHGKHGPRYSYMLCAVKQDGEEVRLLTGLSAPDSAAFYEQEIEGWLRITDHPVVGEYGK